MQLVASAVFCSYVHKYMYCTIYSTCLKSNTLHVCYLSTLHACTYIRTYISAEFRKCFKGGKTEVPRNKGGGGGASLESNCSQYAILIDICKA